MSNRYSSHRSPALAKILTIALISLLSACAPEDPTQFIQDGKVLLEQGEFDSARLQFKNALQADPKSVEAYYGLARLHEMNLDLPALRQTLLEVIALNPNHVDAQAKLGLTFPGDMTKAKAQLAIAEKLDPENINTILLASQILAAEHNISEAFRQIDRVFAKDPTNADACVLQGDLFLADQSYQEALAVLNRGLTAHPGNLMLGFIKVHTSLALRNFDEVASDFEALVEKFPANKRLRTEQIFTLAKIGKLEHAEKVLNGLNSDDPANVELKLTLANFIERREPAKIESFLKSLIQASPGELRLKSRLAEYYLAQRRLADAESLLSELVAADPVGKSGLTAKVHQAELAWEKGEREVAERLTDEVIKVDSGNSGALWLRANTRVAKQDADGAISDLRIFMRDRPNSDQAMLAMAQAYAVKGDKELAETQLRKAFETNPGNFSAVAPLVTLHLKRGDATRAEELMLKSLKANPGNPSAWELLINLRRDQKNWAAAGAALSELKKIPQASPLALMLEARLAADQGQHADAIHAYKAVLSQQPNAAEALSGLARAYQAIGKRKEFLAFLEDFVRLNPENVVAHNVLGIAYVAENKWSDADNILRQALTLNPKFAASYKLMAAVLAKTGKVNEIPALYQRGLEATPDHPELMLELARFYNGIKDYPASIAAYRRVLEKYPANEDAANSLAYLLIEFGSGADRFEQAVKLTERFKNTSNPYYLDTYAWALLKSGATEAAVYAFKKAVAMMPENPEFQYHLGEAYNAVGDRNAAKQALERSLSFGQGAAGFSGIDRTKALLKQVGS